MERRTTFLLICVVIFLVSVSFYGGILLSNSSGVPDVLQNDVTHIGHDNLYIGYGVGYNASLIQRFVNGVQRHCGKTCDIVLFVKEGLHPMTFEYPQNVYLITRTNDNERYRHIMRYWIIDNWLRDNKRTYAKVIFSDIRDIIIQTNPFDQITEQAVYTFEERYFVSEEPFNQGWIKTCLGDEYLQKLIQQKQKVICCGVVMGTYREMQSYFSEMAKLLTWTKDNRVDCFHSFGLDTVANYQLMLDVLPKSNTKAIVVKEGDGYSSHMLRRNYQRDSMNRVLNNHGKPYALIHHADRMKMLFTAYEAMYPYNDNSMSDYW
jgi:hypothetical protein